MISFDQIYNEDCLVGMDRIPDKSIDMILCDLPYGTTACSWDSVIPFDALWNCYTRIIKDGGAIVLFGTEPFSSQLRLSNLSMFKYDWVWVKSKSGSAFTAQYRPVCKHEMISVFGRGTLKYHPQLTKGEPYSRHHIGKEDRPNNHKFGFKDVIMSNNGFRYPITVQYFQQKWRRQDQLHPTQKPVELCEYLIRTYTDEGDTVLDNCMGSGTTAVACIRSRRHFIGFETSKEYCDIAMERVRNTSAVTPKKSLEEWI